MRGVSPSQTLPFAGGQPPTPPGSVSPLHHDQRPALDPLIHRAGIHKTSSQTSSPRPRPGPTRRPITVPCTKPHVPGHNHRRKLRAQTIAAAIQKALGQPRRRQTRTGPSRLVPHTLRAAPDRSRTPASARSTHAATPAGLRGTPAGAPSRLVPRTLGAPAYHSQTTLVPRKFGPLRLVPRTRRAYPSSRTTKTPPMSSLSRRRRAQIRTQSLAEPRTDPIRY